MFAVIETGGKQVKVEVGTEIYVEKIEVEPDHEYVFDKVLLVNDEKVLVGNPYILGAKVIATCIKQGKQKKIIVYKYKKRKKYRKTQGHRQPYTKLVVKAIEA